MKSLIHQGLIARLTTLRVKHSSRPTTTITTLPTLNSLKYRLSLWTTARQCSNLLQHFIFSNPRLLFLLFLRAFTEHTKSLCHCDFEHHGLFLASSCLLGRTISLGKIVSYQRYCWALQRVWIFVYRHFCLKISLNVCK